MSAIVTRRQLAAAELEGDSRLFCRTSSIRQSREAILIRQAEQLPMVPPFGDQHPCKQPDDKPAECEYRDCKAQFVSAPLEPLRSQCEFVL